MVRVIVKNVVEKEHIPAIHTIQTKMDIVPIVIIWDITFVMSVVAKVIAHGVEDKERAKE